MHSNRRIFNFNHFRKLGGFIRSIYFGEISLRHAIERQSYIEDLHRSLNGYKPKKQRKMQSTKEVLENAQNLLMEEDRLFTHLKKIYSYYLHNPSKI